MKPNRIVKAIMKEQNISNAQLGKRINVNNDTIYARLTQENISTDKLIQMLSALDYELVIQPVSRKLPDNSYLVDRSNEE